MMRPDLIQFSIMASLFQVPGESNQSGNMRQRSIPGRRTEEKRWDALRGGASFPGNRVLIAQLETEQFQIWLYIFVYNYKLVVT